uniref:Uncharacterized protein n=1 Tax=Rhizophora mucronata TaxID=61149 RepID=A0A2P2NNV7_RHIMU
MHILQFLTRLHMYRPNKPLSGFQQTT